MIRALIADDEPLARSVVGIARGLWDVEVVGEGRNGVETLGAIRQLAPDLVFLDVQMPELDGFAVLASLAREALPAVVFVTAYGQWLVSASGGRCRRSTGSSIQRGSCACTAARS